MALSGIGTTRTYWDAVGVNPAERTQDEGLTGILGAQSAAASTDELELSDAARALSEAESRAAERQGPLHLGGLDFPRTIPEMERAQEQAALNVEGKLTVLFAEHGIDTSKEIRLQMAGDGRVIVANDHPQKAEIEKFFTDDESLRNEFARMSGLTDLLASAQEAIAFQKAYAKNPQAAVEQYWYLFDSAMDASVSMRIAGNQFQTLYERPGLAPVIFG